MGVTHVLRFEISGRIWIEDEPGFRILLFDKKGRELKMNITNDIAANTSEPITARLVDAGQNTRAGDGPFLWTVVPLGIVALLPNTDGSQCTLRWLAPGAFVVSCAIDADLSPTAKNIITRTITGNAMPLPIPQGTDILFTVGAAVPNV